MLLKDAETGEFVAATLFEGLEARNVDDYETRWRPILVVKRWRAEAGLPSLGGVPKSAYWDWRRKLAASQ